MVVGLDHTFQFLLQVSHVVSKEKKKEEDHDL